MREPRSKLSAVSSFKLKRNSFEVPDLVLDFKESWKQNQSLQLDFFFLIMDKRT